MYVYAIIEVDRVIVKSRDLDGGGWIKVLVSLKILIFKPISEMWLFIDVIIIII